MLIRTTCAENKLLKIGIPPYNQQEESMKLKKEKEEKGKRKMNVEEENKTKTEEERKEAEEEWKVAQWRVSVSRTPRSWREGRTERMVRLSSPATSSGTRSC